MRRTLRQTLAVLAASLLTLGGVRAADAVKVGDKAPSFEAKDDSGKIWKSEDHVGKKIVVLFFFPAAFTGG